MEKKRKFDIQSILLISAAVVIAGLICYMCVEKSIDNKNVAAYESKIVDLQKTIGNLYQEIYLGSDDTDNNDNSSEADGADGKYWEDTAMEYQEELISTYYTNEDIMDTMARILFKKAVLKISNIRLSDMREYPEAVPGDTTEIEGTTYVKRDAMYADVLEEYSRIFTGDLLDQIINERFVEKDGYLYVSEGDGAGGSGLHDVEVTRVSETDGEITYNVKFNFEAPDGSISDYETCTITLKAVGNSYAISATDYFSAE